MMLTDTWESVEVTFLCVMSKLPCTRAVLTFVRGRAASRFLVKDFQLPILNIAL